MRRWPLLVLLFAMSCAAVAQSGASSPVSGLNPGMVVGSWELNLRSSSWGTLPPPKSATINVLQFDGRGMQWTANSTDENGNAIEASWAGALDGTPVEATGTDTGIYYSFQSGEDGIHELTTFPDGSRISSVATFSSDGTTLTLRRHMSSPTRGEADWTEVYNKTTTGE